MFKLKTIKNGVAIVLQDSEQLKNLVEQAARKADFIDTEKDEKAEKTFVNNFIVIIKDDIKNNNLAYFDIREISEPIELLKFAANKRKIP